MITKAEIIAATKGYDLIQSEAEETAQRWLDKFSRGWETISCMELDIWDIDFDDPEAVFEFETECGSSGYYDHDHNYYSIPVSYIWDPEWEQAEYDRRAEEEKLKQKKAATKLEQDRLVKEAKRYQSYLEMKEEYEGK